MISQIYIDLDGVLFNFRGMAELVLGKPYPEITKRELWKMVNNYPNGWFEAIPPMIDGEELLEFCQNTSIPVKILTATGNRYFDVTEQKRKACWNWYSIETSKIITVKSGKDKDFYATDTSVLIDDTPAVIEAWVAAGGIGILHTDTASTLIELKKLLTY